MKREESELIAADSPSDGANIIDAGLGRITGSARRGRKNRLYRAEILEQLKLYDLPQMQADFADFIRQQARSGVDARRHPTPPACG